MCTESGVCLFGTSSYDKYVLTKTPAELEYIKTYKDSPRALLSLRPLEYVDGVYYFTN